MTQTQLEANNRLIQINNIIYEQRRFVKDSFAYILKQNDNRKTKLGISVNLRMQRDFYETYDYVDIDNGNICFVGSVEGGIELIDYIDDAENYDIMELLLWLANVDTE